jgi:hypothetical protein
MSEPLFYHEIQFSRLSGALPEKVGSFVVGIPTKALEEYRKEHPTEGTDAAFRRLLSTREIQRMQDSLGFRNLSLELIPFHGEPITLGEPTFKGEEGKNFGKFSNPTKLFAFPLVPEKISSKALVFMM